MPKATLVPCPDCGESGFTVFIQELNGEWRGNCGCGHTTRYCKTREAAIAAWNRLPRAFRWTHEPPKVAGWYFQRAMGKEKTQRIAFVSATLSGLHCKCGCSSRPLAHWVGFEWAGPIPPPID